ncbi:xylulokinase [Marinilactibacillus kalidii]|uniref:xylulokinase n=1 Tax=Marinilactibacillus kalidii TaxID=2820274 RepID=UPI001ABE0553|nr:xylulokinase [Marinilactibacillus kalidii]
MSYVLGLDLGTSGLKGILMNRSGQVVKTAESGYPLLSPERGHSEQDPKEWFMAAQKVMKQISESVADFGEKLEGISFSGQMHSLVLLDKEDRILRNAILWNDVRTTSQCRTIEKTLGDQLLTITKNRALEGFTLPKLLWVEEHEKRIYDEIDTFLLPKDYLGFCLTGHKQMEYSDAAGTLLLDVQEKKWSNVVLEAFSIDPTICPPLVSSTDMIGYLKTDIQEELGLLNPVKVFSGGADNACAAVGAGIVRPDQAMASIGTSGVFLSNESDGEVDYKGELHLFNHVIPATHYSMGVTLAAGSSLSWYKHTFAPEQSYEALLENIDLIKPGSDGLLFTPYISGERTPHIDSTIRGSFIGMDISHTRDHFSRAVLEGITFSLRDAYELMKAHVNTPFDTIVSVGGGAKNKAWLQMQADIFNVKVVTLETEQGPGIGSAMIAAVGAGWFEGFQTCAEVFVRYKDEYVPDKDAVEKYQEIYPNYRQIYAATKQLNVDISKL